MHSVANTVFYFKTMQAIQSQSYSFWPLIIMSSATSWKNSPPVTPPMSNGKKVVIKELEKKLKHRKISDPQRSKDLPSASEQEKQPSKTLTEKQIINENMLAARARWLERSEATVASGNQEVDTSDRRNFVQSYDAAVQNRIKVNGRAQSCEASRQMRIETRDDNAENDIPSPPNRTYSNSMPQTQAYKRVAIPPPKNNPPVLSEITPPDNSTQINPERAQGNHERQIINKSNKQTSSGGTSTSVAVKKLLRLVKKKKPKQAKPCKPVKRNKSAVQFNMTNMFLDDDPSRETTLPISIPTLGYQNVFDDPQFARYHQQHQQQNESRSNTNSPSDLTRQLKKPKPLPRKILGNVNSTGSDRDEQDSEIELETPPLQPLFSPPSTMMCPILMQIPESSCVDQDSSKSLTSLSSFERPHNSHNRSYSVSSLSTNEPHLVSHLRVHSDQTGGHNDLVASLGSRQGPNVRQALGKTSSYNPESSGHVPVRNTNSLKQKAFRHGICSDGDQDELNDGYIKMNPVCLSSSLTKKQDSMNLSVSQGGLSVPSDPKRSSAYYLKIISGDVKPEMTLPSSNRSPDMLESYGEVVSRNRPIVSHTKQKPKLKKGKTAPSLSVSSESGQDAFIPVSASLPIHSMNSPSKKKSIPQKAATELPSDTAPVSAKAISQPKSSQRKIQYTPVSVKSGGKKEVPNMPNQIKYQTVKLSEEADGAVFEEGDCVDVEKSLRPDEVLRVAKSHDLEGESVALSHPPKKEHPLVNLSSSSDVVTTRSTPQEHSYYVNRKSLIALEGSKDLPTTMLSTVDPVTGRVLWHEYVEINEDVIEKMASSVGVKKTAPIPEKLGILMNLNHSALSNLHGDKLMTNEVMDSEREESNEDEEGGGTFNNTRGLEMADDSNDNNATSDNFGESEGEDSNDEYSQPLPEAAASIDFESSFSSTSSSDCDYVFNLDDPPTVPPRPDNLDEMVDQLKVRASGEYSYAVIPGVNICGTQWFKIGLNKKKAKRKAARTKVAQVCALEPLNDDTCRDLSQKLPHTISRSAIQNDPAMLTPPSVPPKTDSLLREQESSTRHSLTSYPSQPPYIMPIFVKTKRKKTLLSMFSPPNITRSIPEKDTSSNKDKQSPTFISYIKGRSKSPSSANENSPSSKDPRSRKAGSPTKPIPYKEHQRNKIRHRNLESLTSSNVHFQSLDPTHSNTRTAPLEVWHNFVPEEKPVKTLGKKLRGKGKRKKLARQRSQRMGVMNGSHRAHVSQRRHLQDPTHNLLAWKGSSVKGGVHKRRKPRGPRADIINRQSLALIIQSQNLIARQLQDPREVRESDGIENGSESENDAESEENGTELKQTETKPTGRDLGEILSELGHLLKNNHCSENDLLSAIESHFKIKLKKEEEKTAQVNGGKTTEEESARNSGEVDSRSNEMDSGMENGNENDGKPFMKSEVRLNPRSRTGSEPALHHKPPYVNFDFGGETVNIEFDDRTGESTSIHVSTNQDETRTDSVSPNQFPHSFSFPKMASPVTSPMISIVSDRGETSGDLSLKPPTPPKMRTNSAMRLRSKSSIVKKTQLPIPQNHQERFSNPEPNPQGDTEESSLDFFSGSNFQRKSCQDQGVISPPYVTKDSVKDSQVRRKESIDVLHGLSGNTSSYNLALQVEENRLSRSVEVRMPHQTKLATLTEVAEDSQSTCKAPDFPMGQTRICSWISGFDRSSLFMGG